MFFRKKKKKQQRKRRRKPFDLLTANGGLEAEIWEYGYPDSDYYFRTFSLSRVARAGINNRKEDKRFFSFRAADIENLISLLALICDWFQDDKELTPGARHRVKELGDALATILDDAE